jgi:hypothetical protein
MAEDSATDGDFAERIKRELREHTDQALMKLSAEIDQFSEAQSRPRRPTSSMSVTHPAQNNMYQNIFNYQTSDAVYDLSQGSFGNSHLDLDISQLDNMSFGSGAGSYRPASAPPHTARGLEGAEAMGKGDPLFDSDNTGLQTILRIAQSITPLESGDANVARGADTGEVNLGVSELQEVMDFRLLEHMLNVFPTFFTRTGPRAEWKVELSAPLAGRWNQTLERL